MKQPTKEQYSSLSPVERFSYRCADYCNQRLKEPLIWWNRTFMFSLIWIGLSQRLFLHGLKNIESLNEQSRVVIAANHRTFFDFFCYNLDYIYLYEFTQENLFSCTFEVFYDTIIGTILNFFMGGFAMFPPILREKKKRIFNRYSIGRLIEEADTHPLTIEFIPREPEIKVRTFLVCFQRNPVLVKY